MHEDQLEQAGRGHLGSGCTTPMHRFYLANLDGKRGVPYLNGACFDGVFRAMRNRILLVVARACLQTQ